METRIRVANSGEASMRYARVTVPLPHVSTLYGAIVSESYSHQPQEIVEEADGTRLAVFFLENLMPGQEKYVTLTYWIDPSAGDARVSEEWEPREEEQHWLIVRQARLLTRMMATHEARVNRLLSFTRNHIRYDLNSPHRNSDALTALKTGEGVCEEYANLFVALAQAIGIESRVVYGYRYSPVRKTWERHAWAEFVNEEGTWTAADPTFYSRPGLSPDAKYVAQWYQERPIRIGYVGGKLSAGYSDTVRAEPHNVAVGR